MSRLVLPATAIARTVGGRRLGVLVLGSPSARERLAFRACDNFGRLIAAGPCVVFVSGVGLFAAAPGEEGALSTAPVNLCVHADASRHGVVETTQILGFDLPTLGLDADAGDALARLTRALTGTGYP